jgi:hypothetical protein
MIKRCAVCQQFKNVQQGHSDTAPCEAGLLPWREVAVDAIGPWTHEVATECVTFYGGINFSR